MQRNREGCAGGGVTETSIRIVQENLAIAVHLLTELERRLESQRHNGEQVHMSPLVNVTRRKIRKFLEEQK
jgi:hypothetical protein